MGWNKAEPSSFSLDIIIKEAEMIHHEDHDELTEQEASGGVKVHAMRYVLGISLVLAISALTLIWVTGGL